MPQFGFPLHCHPAQAGTHGVINADFSWIIPLGPRLRGDDREKYFKLMHYRLESQLLTFLNKKAQMPQIAPHSRHISIID